MARRIVSGLIGGALALMIIIFNQNCLWLINVTVSIISFLSIREIFSVMGTSGFYEITIPTLIFVPILPLTGMNLFWQASFYLYTLAMLSSMLINKKTGLKNVCTTYTMAIILSFSLYTIVALRDYGGKYGSFYVLLALTIAWMSDTGAYFFGKYLGKNKLCPSVSPKKTVEGFFGGMGVCLLCVVFLGIIFNNFVFSEKHQINYFLIIVLSLVGSPISSLGDLCFSVIKRKCGVKDFGNLMPGHGGVLDRFDSAIFVVPYVYIFLKFLPIIF